MEERVGARYPITHIAMARTSLTAHAALLAIAMVWSCAEATDCSKTPDLLENCDQWTACVQSAGVGCYCLGCNPGDWL